MALISNSSGIRLDKVPEETRSIDLLFDEARVWSIVVADHRTARGIEASWPEELKAYLHGSTRVSVRDSATGVEIASQEVSFDKQRSRTLVANAAGTALSVNKWGHLGTSLDAMGGHVQRLIVDRSEQLIHELSAMGLDAFIVGGTLLGAVREGKLLPHDDDADIAYLSEFTDPAEVAREGFAVGHQLEDLGYEIKRHSAVHMQLLFRDNEGEILHYIDVFSAFFTDDGHINQPFHVRGEMRQDQLVPFTEVSLEGKRFPAPANPNRWLIINYDRHWRTPIPGFKLVTPEATRRRFLNWFGGFNYLRDFWDVYYQEDHDYPLWDSGSDWLTEKAPALSGDAIVELGCGTGELTRRLASQCTEQRVIGLDYSHPTIDQAREISGPYSNAEFGMINLNRMQSLLLPQKQKVDTTFDVVMNFLLEGLSPEAREYAWRIMRMALRSGGQAWFTFAARHAPHASPEDPRGWHLTHEGLEAEARRFGLMLSFEEISPFGRSLRYRQPSGAVVSLTASRLEGSGT